MFTNIQLPNTLRPRANRGHFAGAFSSAFSRKFVPKSPINTTPVLVRIIVMSEAMKIGFAMYIYVTRPYWAICDSHSAFRRTGLWLLWTCFLHALYLCYSPGLFFTQLVRRIIAFYNYWSLLYKPTMNKSHLILSCNAYIFFCHSW